MRRIDLSDLFGDCDLCGRPLGGFDAECLPMLAYSIPLISGKIIKVCWPCVFEERRMSEPEVDKITSARFAEAREED